MRYMGGKERVTKYIVPYIHAALRPGDIYIEPFLGGGSILSCVRWPHRYAYDVNEALVTMWQALQQGWEPPSEVSEALYAEYKMHRNPKDPLTAFIGFGCSYSGKWFGGYCRPCERQRNYALSAKNSLAKKTVGVHGAHIAMADYRDIAPSNRAVIYCDPPYDGTTSYKGTPKWCSATFWDHARRWSAEGHTVLVSEYNAPPDAIEIWDRPKRLGLRTKDGGQEMRMERLFWI